MIFEVRCGMMLQCYRTVIPNFLPHETFHHMSECHCPCPSLSHTEDAFQIMWDILLWNIICS